MKTTQLAIATFVAASLAAVPLAAQAKNSKKHNAATPTTSSQTTGSNMQTTGSSMKSGRDSTSSSQGNVGPGTNQAGSMGK
ncbi:hypothetical protein [Bradyrhizobium aeschynomenes]|uniref:hypothetical protein n=1 Tax=Bradyrhizobium aeschynomenes TaxID=2734909 RepID=UPI0015542959|nr:hypothetical protein [Bradyrhizobium aeschynomenes]NPV20120.1 hypothetical protein [Bradyrhizobium aeschynomenes]